MGGSGLLDRSAFLRRRWGCCGAAFAYRRPWRQGRCDGPAVRVIRFAAGPRTVPPGCCAATARPPPVAGKLASGDNVVNTLKGRLRAGSHYLVTTFACSSEVCCDAASDGEIDPGKTATWVAVLWTKSAATRQEGSPRVPSGDSLSPGCGRAGPLLHAAGDWRQGRVLPRLLRPLSRIWNRGGARVAAFAARARIPARSGGSVRRGVGQRPQQRRVETRRRFDLG